MNILLTGSTGFLGRRVLPLLSKYNVTCFSGNLLKINKFPSYDLIIHLAATVPKTKKEDTRELYDKNICMCQKLPSTRIIFASTIEAYSPNTWYGKSKLACEKLLPDATILRFSVMYGAGDQIDRAIPNFVRYAITGEHFTIAGAGNKRDYLHVDDAARAVLCAVINPAPGIFFVGSGHTTTIRQAARAIAPDATIREKPAPKHDLIFDTRPAQNMLKFKPTYIFPNRINELIPRPIVFDLDGTILDVSKKYTAIPKEKFKELIETPKYLALDTIYPPMLDILKYVYGKFPIYIVTMRKNRPNLLAQLTALGLDRFFPVHRVVNPKDKIKAVSKIKPSVVIGDTELDKQAAIKAAAAFILATGRINPRVIIERIHENQPHHRHPRV